MKGSHNQHGVIDRPEQRWVGRLNDLRAAAGIYELALEAGESPATAAGFSHWLVRLAVGSEEGVNAQTRWRYRKILQRIEELTPPDRVKRAMGGVYLTSDPLLRTGRRSRRGSRRPAASLLAPAA